MMKLMKLLELTELLPLMNSSMKVRILEEEISSKILYPTTLQVVLARKFSEYTSSILQQYNGIECMIISG